MKLAHLNLLLTFTLAFAPYLMIVFLNIDQNSTQILPVCLELPSQDPQGLLCLSCFERDPQVTPEGYGIHVKDYQDNQQNNNHLQNNYGLGSSSDTYKRIINAPLNKLNCEQVIQMLDYSGMEAGRLAPSVGLIDFDSSVRSIKVLVKNLNITISQATKENSLYIDEKTQHIAVLQATSSGTNRKYLTTVSYPSMETIDLATMALTIACIALIIFCFLLLLFKLSHQECYTSIFGNIMCLGGFLLSFYYFKMHHSYDTDLYMDMEVLWGCICLIKTKVPRPIIAIAAAVGILLSFLIASDILGGFSRAIFLLIATFSMIQCSKERPESSDTFAYLGPCLCLVTIISLWVQYDKDIKCILMKNIIMLLSLGLCQFSEAIKVEEFKQYLSNAAQLTKEGKGFQRVQEDQQGQPPSQ